MTPKKRTPSKQFSPDQSIDLSTISTITKCSMMGSLVGSISKGHNYSSPGHDRSLIKDTNHTPKGRNQSTKQLYSALKSKYMSMTIEVKHLLRVNIQRLIYINKKVVRYFLSEAFHRWNVFVVIEKEKIKYMALQIQNEKRNKICSFMKLFQKKLVRLCLRIYIKYWKQLISNDSINYLLASPYDSVINIVLDTEQLKLFFYSFEKKVLSACNDEFY